jgi:hypothetical protein
MQFLKDAVPHTAPVAVLLNSDGKSRNLQPRCLKVTMLRVVIR